MCHYEKVALLSEKELNALFHNTAAKMGMTDAIVEKDFWVCYARLPVPPHAWKHNAFKVYYMIKNSLGKVNNTLENSLGKVCTASCSRRKRVILCSDAK